MHKARNSCIRRQGAIITKAFSFSHELQLFRSLYFTKVIFFIAACRHVVHLSTWKYRSGPEACETRANKMARTKKTANTNSKFAPRKDLAGKGRSTCIIFIRLNLKRGTFNFVIHLQHRGMERGKSMEVSRRTNGGGLALLPSEKYDASRSPQNCS